MKEQQVVALDYPVKNVVLDKSYKETHDDMYRGLILCLKEDKSSTNNRKIFPSMICTCTTTPMGEFLLVLKDENIIYNVEV